VVEKQADSISVKEVGDTLSIDVNCPSRLIIKNTPNNRKVLYVLLRVLKSQNGKNLLTFKKISLLFGLHARQDSNNFFREFQFFGEDFYQYLERKRKLKEAFPLIEKQILKYPLTSIKEHYRLFLKEHPKFKMSESSFRKYASDIDAVKLKKRFEQLTTKGEIKPDKEQFLKEIIADENTSKDIRKQIIKVFPELEPSDKEVSREISFIKDSNKFGKNLLVMLLIGSGLNYKILSILMGVSKATIHNMFYYLTFLKRLILGSIKWWSGKITTDEKWVRINGTWHYVISIIDDVTGFPLYFQVVSDLQKNTWKLFFDRFYKLYGTPKLIISDGSDAIAGAIKMVFPDVNHQLCKFHKLKNLTRKIYKSNHSYKKKQKMVKLAKGIFDNSTYFSRKRAARRLMEIGSPEISRYVKNSIMGKWKQLTKGLTSNSAERWNRKIEKVIQGRYGLKSEKFVNQLITSLWLKETLIDKRHFGKSFIQNVNFTKISQENLQTSNIIEFFKRNLLKKVA